ncbi:MAG: GSCFA domain-containing protein [Bacteroidota bacterium]
MSLGSCFSELIGKKLLESKFNILNNPFGTIYNPLSIFQILKFGINKELPNEESYVLNREVWYNYFFHSKLSSTSLNELKANVNQLILRLHESLKDTDFLVLTLGSAYGYELKDRNEWVANCHKMPSGLFDKKLMDIEELDSVFEKTYSSLKNFNPKIKIILTVSPVRHVKDSLQLNSVSKSTLRLFCHKSTENYEDVKYFPSYEIMTDDLRDYRFYSDDLIHPNNQAELYIWEKFKETQLSLDSISLVKRLEKLYTSLEHRPFHPNTKEHLKFLQNLLAQFQEIDESVNVSDEINNITHRIDQIKNSNPG